MLAVSISVAMLAIFSIICIYGALASLVNCIFAQRSLPMGQALLKVCEHYFMFCSMPIYELH